MSSASRPSSSAGPSATDFVIVGAGVYGTSLAYTLSKNGYSVVVLDRSTDGYVAVDGASHDLNKIIRADYSDTTYTSLAKLAISRWRTHPTLKPFYHETGVLFRSSSLPNSNSNSNSNSSVADKEGKGKGEAGELEEQVIFGSTEKGSAEQYAKQGVFNAALSHESRLEYTAPGLSLPPPAHLLEHDSQIEAIFASSRTNVKLGPGLAGFGATQTGYFNPRGGWAEANNACRALLDQAKRQGVRVVPGAHVDSLLLNQDRDQDQRGEAREVQGVRCRDGRTFHASNVVLCTGAWTCDLIDTFAPGLPITPTRPSAQCVVLLSITPQEAKLLQNTPVILNFSSGFYIFEPTLVDPSRDTWRVKIAIHSPGFQFPRPPSTSEEYSGTFPRFEDSRAQAQAQAQAQEHKQAQAQAQTQTQRHAFEKCQSTIPASQLQQMLAEVADIYPFLADVSRVVTTRVCWYSDTLDENWIVDRLPLPLSLSPSTTGAARGSAEQGEQGKQGTTTTTEKWKNVWIASGDSGHGYKFLPVLGDLFSHIAGFPPKSASSADQSNSDTNAKVELQLQVSAELRQKLTFDHQVRLHLAHLARIGREKAANTGAGQDAKKSAPNLRARL